MWLNIGHMDPKTQNQVNLDDMEKEIHKNGSSRRKRGISSWYK